MSKMTTEPEPTVPLALHVPKAFTFTDRGLQRASDWVEYVVHAGLYRIRFVSRNWTPMDGNTEREAKRLGLAKADAMPYPVDRTAYLPYHAVATLDATKTTSYHENQLFSAVSGHHAEHHELTTIRWSPYAYEVKVGEGAYVHWIGEGTDRKCVPRAHVVELQPCDECEADAGERCKEGCQGQWDGVIAANAGSAS